MEKQGRGQMAKGKWTALVLVGFSLVSPWATHSSLLLAQQKTSVADTLLGPDGAPVAGSFVVTCPRTFVSADGSTVLAQSKTSVTLAANGSFSVNLIPNAGSSPGGSTYQVQYTANSRVVTEIWVVPISTSPVNLAAVRTASPPSPGVMLPSAQLNPPSGCAANQFLQWTGTNWTCVTSNGEGEGGGGTVSSVGLSLPLAVFSVSGSPVTSSGTLNASFTSQSANQVLAAPNGTAGAPSFRALGAADLPASLTSSTSGNAATATALASSPNQCAGGQYATGIAASGNANCGVPPGTLGGLTTNLLPVASSSSSLTNSSLSSLPALAATTLGTITAAVGSGSLNATTTYYYTVVPLTASGIGPASAEGSFTTASGGNTYTVTVPYSAVSGAAGYCLMGRGSSGGEQLLSCVHSGSTLSIADSGAATPGGSFPANASALAGASGSFVPVYEDGVVHAAQMPGSDMCAQISNGWAFLVALGLSSGTVDARGITGTQNVSGSCFNNYANNQSFNGTLLTQSVEIVTSISQVLPNGLRWDGGSLRAEAPPQLSSPVGTTVVQATGFPASTPVIQYGKSQSVPQLGIRLQNLGVSCIPPGGNFSGTSIGVQDLYAQEHSGADYLNVYGCEVGVDIENGGGGSPAINGGPWNNVKVALGGTADSTAVCFRYGSTAAQTSALFGVHTLNCSGNNSGSQLTAAGIQIDGSYINIDGVHVEQTAVGVEIAKNHSSYSATLSNVHCLSLGGVQGTSCVDISASNAANVVLMGIAVNSTLTTNVIKDNQTNGCTLPTATAGNIGIYVRDAHNRITTSSQDCTASPAVTASALAAVPSQCSGSQFSTGIAANGNANCATPAGGGNISNFGTPTANQIAQWTNSTTIQGISTLPASALPAPTASTLGGIESITAASHNWISYVDTSGVPHQAQPGFSDLSGSLACAQHPALTGDTTVSAGSCATTTAKINGGSVPTSAPFVGTNSSGQLVSATPVTSVAMTGDGTVFNAAVSGSPVTASGTFAPALLTQTANTVLAGPISGSAAAPAFRALAAADLGGANNPYCDATDPTCLTVNEEFFTASGSSSTSGGAVSFNNMWEFRFGCGTSGGQSLGISATSTELGQAALVECTTSASGDTVAAHIASGASSASLQFGNIANWRAVLRLQLDGTTSEALRAGFCASGTAASSLCPGSTGNSINIRYDTNQSDTGFYGEMCNSTACAQTSSALCAVDTSAHTFLLRSVTAHTVLFSCDGGAEYSVSADYPTGGVVPTFWHQTLATTQHTIKLHFFKLKVWGLSR